MILFLLFLLTFPTNAPFPLVNWLSGLILSLVIRVYHRTTNPVWPIMNAQNGGLNREFLILGFVLSLIAIVRNIFPPPSTGVPMDEKLRSTYARKGGNNGNNGKSG